MSKLPKRIPPLVPFLFLSALVLGLFTFLFKSTIFPKFIYASDLFVDGFETDYSNWTSNGLWTIVGTSHTGSKSAKIVGNTSGDTILSKNLSTLDKQNIVFSYWYKVQDKLEGSDHLFVEYTTDGSTWLALTDYSNTNSDPNWFLVSYNLPSSANDNPNFEIRFRANLSSGSDDFRLDDISLTGDDLVTPTPSPTVTPAPEAGNPSADIDQCANGGIGNPPESCTSTNWVNGNLGASKAHYLEGDFIPYRIKLDNLTPGFHSLTIEWDTTKSGKHAIDYLGTYDASENSGNDPCSGISGCDVASGNSFPISLDPVVANGQNGIPSDGDDITQIPGNLTIFGGTITSVSPYIVTGSYAGDSSTQITVNFTALVNNPVLAWGGHISSRIDWGLLNSAINIPGSPYHMRLLDLDGSGGNQDRSLSAEAIIFPASITVIKNAIPDHEDDFQFTTSGLSDFNLDDDGDPILSNTQVFSGITNFDSKTITEMSSPNWNLTSLTCLEDISQNSITNLDTETATINLEEGENVTCTFTNSKLPTLTLQKTVINDHGGIATADDFQAYISDTQANWNAPYTFAPGQYLASETTLPTYQPSDWSGDCAADGSITLSYGDNKTCTITNDDQPGHLIVNKVTDPIDTITEFSVTISGTSEVEDATQAIVSGQTVDYTVAAGTYSVNEAGSDGWMETASTCTDITIINGETKQCSVTNTKLGSLTITKDARPNDEQNFEFTGTLDTFILDDDNGLGPEADLYQNSKLFSDLLPGSYTIEENLPNDFWTLDSISCQDLDTGSNLEFIPTPSGIQIDLLTGMNIQCTFVNSKPSPTRTQGFWQTHTDFTSQQFAVYFPSGMLIGTVPSGHKGYIFNELNPGKSQLLGAYFANIAKTTLAKGKTGQRTSLDKARMQLLQQLVTAKLNCATFSCTTAEQNLINAADIAYANGDIIAILISAINLDAYNNSGDTLVVPNLGHATPQLSQSLADIVFWNQP